jgi:hypothetical protein
VIETIASECNHTSDDPVHYTCCGSCRMQLLRMKSVLDYAPHPSLVYSSGKHVENKKKAPGSL